MIRTIDTPARTSIRLPAHGFAHGFRELPELESRRLTLRQLARLTFPGLEPWSSGYSTGYGRTLDGLVLPPLCTRSETRACLKALEAGRLCYRVGARGWCVSRAGRELAASIYGDAVLARESEPDERDGRRTLIEGRVL